MGGLIRVGRNLEARLEEVLWAPGKEEVRTRKRERRRPAHPDVG